MLSSNLNVNFIVHGQLGKHNEKLYVVDMYYSSQMIERHLFFNKRTYRSFISHLDTLFPSFVSSYYSGISFDYFDLYYSKETYDSLLI